MNIGHVWCVSYYVDPGGVATGGGGIVQTHHVVPLLAGHSWRRGSRAEVRTVAGVSDAGAGVSPRYFLSFYTTGPLAVTLSLFLSLWGFITQK